MRKRPKMSANAVSGLLASNMEFHVLYKIGVVSEPMVGTELRYEAFPDGFLDWYFRLVGHEVWREIQIQILGLDDSNYFHQGGYFLSLLTQRGQNKSEIIKYKVRSAKK